MYMQKGTVSPSVGAHVYCSVQKSQENVRQKHLLCQSISKISMAGLHLPDYVFFLWKQEIQHDDSKFMGGRRPIVLDVCVGDP